MSYLLSFISEHIWLFIEAPLREVNNHLIIEALPEYLANQLQILLFALINPGVFGIETHQKRIDFLDNLQRTYHLGCVYWVSAFTVPEPWRVYYQHLVLHIQKRETSLHCLCQCRLGSHIPGYREDWTVGTEVVGEGTFTHSCLAQDTDHFMVTRQGIRVAREVYERV